jgi:hypothetical protein
MRPADFLPPCNPPYVPDDSQPGSHLQDAFFAGWLDEASMAASFAGDDLLRVACEFSRGWELVLMNLPGCLLIDPFLRMAGNSPQGEWPASSRELVLADLSEI